MLASTVRSAAVPRVPKSGQCQPLGRERGGGASDRGSAGGGSLGGRPERNVQLRRGQATHLGNSVPVAGGVYLDNVALAVCVTPPPFVFKGGAGIHIGPTTNGVAPVTLNGSLQYTDTRPWCSRHAEASTCSAGR